MAFMDSRQDEKFVIKTCEDAVKYDSRGLGYNLFHAMRKHGNKIAQIDASTCENQTYETLLKQCIRTAIHMRRFGITKNDIVSMCCYNRLESCIPFIAATFLGAKIATLDPRQTNVRKLIVQLQPKLIFADKHGIDFVVNNSVSANMISFDVMDDYVNFEEFLKPDAEEDDFKPYENNNEMKETAAVFFTSGTTGLSKGACLNHYALLHQGYNFMCKFGANADKILSTATLYWISACNILVASTMEGFCRIVYAEFDPKDAWVQIDKHKPTCLIFSATHAIAMCKAGLPKDIDVSSVKKFGFGGSAVSENVYKELVRMLPEADVSQAYGQTEISGLVTFFDANKSSEVEESRRKPLSCGKPINGICYKVVDLETEKSLGPHRQGELRVKTKFLFNGYYKTDSSDSFDSEGWFKTGDLVYYDEDNCFYIVDRLKELYKYKDWHVAPLTIEKILQGHPSVQNCLVVGLPHEDDTNHSLGIVVLKPNCKNTHQNELIEYVAKNSAKHHHLTAGVKFIKSFPSTPTGKLNRRYIKSLIIDGKI